MKTLFILRHAEAAPNSSADLERSLTARGMEDARALGALMKEKKYAPGLVVCSSALRTKQTLDCILESVKIPAAQYDKAIYHATAADLLSYAQALNDQYDQALIVGHNPTVHEFCARLTGDDRLAPGFPPGTLAVLKIPRASWKDLQDGENRLSDLVSAGKVFQ